MKNGKDGSGTNRRNFLSAVGAAAAVAVSIPTVSILSESNANADDIGPQGGRERAEQAENLRQRVAEIESRVEIPQHQDNGDEARYPNKIGNYSKNLKHDPTTGEVDHRAYEALIAAISSGRFSDFEALATNWPVRFSGPNRSTPAGQPGVRLRV